MKKKEDVFLELPASFFEQVYWVVQFIPKGKFTTYGAIAKFLSTAGSSRMVGWAMNHAHQLELYVPAHRVVNRYGCLTGKHHFGSSNLMQELLENEGIEIQLDRIIHFNRHFWDPEKYLLKTDQKIRRLNESII